MVEVGASGVTATDPRVVASAQDLPPGADAWPTRIDVGRTSDLKIDRVLHRIEESVTTLLSSPDLLDQDAKDHLSKVINGYVRRIVSEYSRIPVAWRERELPSGGTSRSAAGQALELFALLLQRDEERIYGRSANYLALERARLEEQVRDQNAAAEAAPSEFGAAPPSPVTAALSGMFLIVTGGVLLFLIVFILTLMAVKQ